MARKLSVLEVILIIFFLIVLAVDIFLLFLVLEKPSGKGDAVAAGLEELVKEVPSGCQRNLSTSFPLWHAAILYCL